MSYLGRVLLKVRWTRPLPQLRILRSYSVSLRRQPRLFLGFVLTGRETTNFTYEIANTEELVDFVATALQRPAAEIAGYVQEVEEDAALHAALSTQLARRNDLNSRPMFGRRVGWYCLVRALKPRLVVETGTADGLGTALLAQALTNNALTGSPGELLSFDIDPQSGWLLDTPTFEGVRLVIGDALTTLPSELDGRKVDLFIHDSDHSYEHERAELDLAVLHGSNELVLVSDNAHATTALREICFELGSEYRFFRERPVAHFYPGAGIGVALVGRGGSVRSSVERAHA